MSIQPRLLIFGASGLLVGLLLLAGPGPADAQYQLTAEAVGSGGGSMTGGSYAVTGTVGQGAAVETSGGGLTLGQGLWPAVLAAAGTSTSRQSSAAKEIPDEYMLGPNYPNPFNPSTVIRYSLPEEVRVRLAVYDMLGRQVQVLVDGQRPAGIHEVKFEAAGLPSGTYLYRVEAGGFSDTGMMSLIK